MIAKIIIGILLLGTAGAYFGIKTPEMMEMEVVDKYVDTLSQPGMKIHIYCVRSNHADTNSIRTIGKRMFQNICKDDESNTTPLQLIMYVYHPDSTEAIPEVDIQMALARDPNAREIAKQFQKVRQGKVYVQYSAMLIGMGAPPDNILTMDYYKPSGGKYRYKTIVDQQVEARRKQQH